MYRGGVDGRSQGEVIVTGCRLIGEYGGTLTKGPGNTEGDWSSDKAPFSRQLVALLPSSHQIHPLQNPLNTSPKWDLFFFSHFFFLRERFFSIDFLIEIL